MRVLTPERMREIERRAIEGYGIDGLLLMERAALALAEEVLSSRAGAGRPLRALLVCGSGNNGGDAYACARMLHLKGAQVFLLPLCPVEKLPPDARKNAQICQALGIPAVGLEALERDYDAVVDGVFGTGLSRAPAGAFAQAIAGINRAGARGARIVSVDIPSGIDGATGQPLGEAVRAETTVTFQWAKRGHFLYPGASCAGRLVVADIGIPDPAQGFLPEDAEVLDAGGVRALLPRRARDAHKNDFGHALLVAGSRGMAGAAVLTATACMRAGAGLLTVLAPERSVLPQVQSAVPVAMCLPLAEAADGALADDAAALSAALPGKSAVGVGPGLSRAPGRAGAVRAALASNLPAVVDADGLYHLAGAQGWLARGAQTVLTPHPGEMARLLGRPVADPVRDAADYAQAHGCTVLLKGALTIIAAPDGRLTFNCIGTSGMATAGSGDALTGIVLALLAQGMDGYDAARAAAYLHAEAGLRAETAFGAASMNALDMARSVRL